MQPDMRADLESQNKSFALLNRHNLMPTYCPNPAFQNMLDFSFLPWSKSDMMAWWRTLTKFMMATAFKVFRICLFFYILVWDRTRQRGVNGSPIKKFFR